MNVWKLFICYANFDLDLISFYNQFLSDHLGEQEVLGEVPVVPVQVDYANDNRDERVILDSMIERLQREQDERLAVARGEPFRSPPPPGASPRASRVNSSELTGIEKHF